MNSNYLKCIKRFLLSLFSDLKQNFEYRHGSELEKKLKNIFKIKKKYNFVYSGFLYKEKLIKDIIWRIKFRGDHHLIAVFEDFVQKTVDNLAQQEKILYTDQIVILPIPLHKKRLRARGFNQSEIIAQLVLKCFEKFNAQLDKNCLKRINNNDKQSWKNKSERINQKNYFKFTSSTVLENKIIIIVDDVVTTGITLEMAKSTIQSNSAFCKIFALTLAY